MRRFTSPANTSKLLLDDKLVGIVFFFPYQKMFSGIALVMLEKPPIKFCPEATLLVAKHHSLLWFNPAGS